MKYYPHHIGDFNHATRHLTRIERSVYRDLIELYYDTEQQLSLDIDFICRKIVARSDEERTAVEQTLNEFFVRTGTGWYHARCEEEIEKYQASTSQKSAAGRASAAKRALKMQQAINEDATGDQRAFNERSTNHEPLTTNHEPLKDNIVAFAPDVVESQQTEKPDKPDKRKLVKPEYSPEFELAWEKYPKRPGANKKDAFHAWSARIKAGVAADDILGGVARYAKYVEVTGTLPQYVKQPETFFGPSNHFASDWSPPPTARASPKVGASGLSMNDFEGGRDLSRYKGLLYGTPRNEADKPANV